MYTCSCEKRGESQENTRPYIKTGTMCQWMDGAIVTATNEKK